MQDKFSRTDNYWFFFFNVVFVHDTCAPHNPSIHLYSVVLVKMGYYYGKTLLK